MSSARMRKYSFVPRYLSCIGDNSSVVGVPSSQRALGQLASVAKQSAPLGRHTLAYPIAPLDMHPGYFSITSLASMIAASCAESPRIRQRAGSQRWIQREERATTGGQRGASIARDPAQPSSECSGWEYLRTSSRLHYWRALTHCLIFSMSSGL